jgi:hypothetical protein
MRTYKKAILLVALMAANSALASEEPNSFEDAIAAEGIRLEREHYMHFDARLQPVPEDPSFAKSIEVEPLIRSLGVHLEPGVEAPDFDLPVLLVEENDQGEKRGAVGNDTVTLSSFRGRKPVALTFSGST